MPLSQKNMGAESVKTPDGVYFFLKNSRPEMSEYDRIYKSLFLRNEGKEDR